MADYGVLYYNQRASRKSGGVYKKEANVYGDRDLLLRYRYVSGEIRRVRQVIEEGRSGPSLWTFVPCVFWPERQSDGVRCLVIAGGIRQVRQDSDYHPATTWDRGTTVRDAGAQRDLAGAEGEVAREAVKGLCSAEETLTTIGVSRLRVRTGPCY